MDQRTLRRSWLRVASTARKGEIEIEAIGVDVSSPANWALQGVQDREPGIGGGGEANVIIIWRITLR